MQCSYSGTVASGCSPNLAFKINYFISRHSCRVVRTVRDGSNLGSTRRSHLNLLYGPEKFSTLRFRKNRHPPCFVKSDERSCITRLIDGRHPQNPVPANSLHYMGYPHFRLPRGPRLLILFRAEPHVTPTPPIGDTSPSHLP